MKATPSLWRLSWGNMTRPQPSAIVGLRQPGGGGHRRRRHCHGGGGGGGDDWSVVVATVVRPEGPAKGHSLPAAQTVRSVCCVQSLSRMTSTSRSRSISFRPRRSHSVLLRRNIGAASRIGASFVRLSTGKVPLSPSPKHGHTPLGVLGSEIAAWKRSHHTTQTVMGGGSLGCSGCGGSSQSPNTRTLEMVLWSSSCRCHIS